MLADQINTELEHSSLAIPSCARVKLARSSGLLVTSIVSLLELTKLSMR